MKSASGRKCFGSRLGTVEYAGEAPALEPAIAISPYFFAYIDALFESLPVST